MNRNSQFARYILCCVWLMVLPTAALAQTERILDYKSDIELRADGSMLVAETIRVQSAGVQIRHGIYRDFPTRYKDRFGNHVVVGFNVISATRDRKPETFRMQDQGNGERVYLGQNNYLLPRGTHVYTITYTTDRQIGFFADRDELFWNVTGNGWIFPIDHASTTVRLPSSIPADSVRVAGYTGPQGSMEHALTIVNDRGVFDFAVTRPLRPREGLTILLSWPKNYIAEPSLDTKFNYFLQDNREALVAGAGLGLILLYYLAVWAAVGRDPAPGTLVTLYEPPGDFSPAATRYLLHMGYDNKVFASAILDMAVKGFLQIKEQAGSYTLYRTKADSRILSPEEKVIADKLFGEGRTEIWLHNENHAPISAAMAALKSALKAAEQKIYFVTNSVYTIPAIVASMATIILAIYLQGGPKVVVAGFLCLWLTVWSFAVAGLLSQAGHLWRSVDRGGRLKAGTAGQAMLVSFVAIPFVGGEIFALSMLVMASSLVIVAILIAAVFLHLLFHQLLKAPTRAGRNVLDKIEGFKMFLGAVDGDRLNRAMPPDQTPQTFEKFLPYALAMDVERSWASKFAGVLNGASASAVATNGYSPAWYSGPSWSSFGAAGFADSFGSSFTSAISSSATAPGSSGGGGGGSGGGGGGGGGGGW
jgi:uncharacterized membrane protein YgcG